MTQIDDSSLSHDLQQTVNGSAPVPIFSWQEDPDRYEQIILEQLEQANTDANIALLLRGNYIHQDPAVAFNEFRESLEFRKVTQLLRTFGARTDSSICEIGGGPGFVSWSLREAGFSNVSLLEPNPSFYTGTGYLREAAGKKVTIVNDLNDWYAEPERYDFIITRNCIHHFPNITYAAASIRQKMTSNGRWFAWREPFAESSKQLYEFLSTHPYTYAHGLFEFAYPVTHYVDSLSMAGFRLASVVPFNYANNSLIMYETSEGDEKNREFTLKVDNLLEKDPAATVRKFWREVFSNRYLRGVLGPRVYSSPSAMLFEKISVKVNEAEV